MANLLQSSQTQTTTAPDYYTKYLGDIASKGADAVNNAQFVGPTDLQTQAFNQVDQASSSYQPLLDTAGSTLTNVSSSTSPLSAATGYLNKAGMSPAELAQTYMSPYISSVINNISDIGQRNIRANLAPSATASAVGSGQFGSQRGVQALGQVMANANQDLNSTIAQALNSGYNTALTTAEQQNALNERLASTASNAASQGQINMTNLGKTQADLASQKQAQELLRRQAHLCWSMPLRKAGARDS